MTEVRFPFKGKMIDAEVVLDTDDIESVDISSHRGFDTGDDGNGHVTRTHNGDNSLTLRIKFKPWCHEKYVEADQHLPLSVEEADCDNCEEIVVMYERNGETHETLIDSQLLLKRTNTMAQEIKGQFIAAAKKMMEERCGAGGKFTVCVRYKEKV